jgi:hypothetical protein
MDRRQFLGAAAGAAGAAWLGHYFLCRPAWAGDEEVLAMGDVAEAYRRGKGLGKPLLVLVIPAADGAKYGRGLFFGALLNHGGTGVYLDLALCEIVCGTVADVRAQLKGLKVEGEPLMLLVDTGDATPSAVPVDPKVPFDPDETLEHPPQQVDRNARARLDKVSAALREAVAPDPTKLRARAALAEARLPAEEVTALRAALATRRRLDAKALDRGAAIVRAAAEEPGSRRPDLLKVLADAAAARITGAAPPGAKWAKTGGCGVEVEGEEAPAVACGMGYVPEISRRFLWLYTKK